MSLINQDAVIVIDGVETSLLATTDRLSRAVIISLFTWRRAAADDPMSGSDPMGWWGDTWPTVANDRIGSRLWLLAREKITNETLERARGYVREALDWMRADGVATDVQCVVTRMGLDAVGLTTTSLRKAGSSLSLRVDNLWGLIRNG